MITFRVGTIADLDAVMELAWAAWRPYEKDLTVENWEKLKGILRKQSLFEELLTKAECFVAETSDQTLVGMAFLMRSGQPSPIFELDWASIRFVSVHPDFAGQGLGRILTQKCIEKARLNGEQTLALHTSELMPNAQHLYGTLGFMVHHEIAPSLGKRYWVYTKDLDS